jgi:hypothetical protein
MENILVRSRTASSSSLIFGIIFGSLMSYAVFYNSIGYKGFFVNIAFLLYMSYYVLFHKNSENPLKACLCVTIADLYLIYVFSLSGIFILNLALYGNEVVQMRLIPTLWPILGTLLISFLVGPFYTRNIIKKKIYKKKGKANMAVITAASVLGMSVGRFFVTNIMSLVLYFFICLIISILTMALYYYLYLFTLILKNKNKV